MRKLLLLLALAPLVSLPSSAQILEVLFEGGEKVEKKYKKHTTVIDGRVCLLGEAVPGGGVRIDSDEIKYQSGDNRNEFFVMDPEDPSWVPYEVVDGVKKPGRKGVVDIPGKHIARLSVYMRSEDIYSLSNEYRFRRARIDDQRRARDELPEGTTAWFAQHQILVTELGRLESWLRRSSFGPAADDLRREIDKEEKISAKEALDARAKRAYSSVRMVEVPAGLQRASNEILGSPDRFHVQESEHIRMVYLTKIGDKQVERLMELGERLIEGFRIEFVDPYRGDDFPDHLPDGIFIEFWFGPDENEKHARFLTDYYGLRWGKHKDKMLEVAGSSHRLTAQRVSLRYWKYDDITDLEGIVTHNLGHVLASLHFNAGALDTEQPWIEEGLAYYLSFEYRGRNTVVCKEIRETDYVTPDHEEGDKTVMLGLRSIYNSMALNGGPRLDKLALKYVIEMEDADIAKSWSLFDYVAKELGRDGQDWLRAACRAASDRSKLIEDWRKASEAIFDVHGQDVFKVIDDRWRAFAQSQQDTSEGFRKQR